MKLIRVVGIAALFLFFGTAFPTYAQQEQPVADKPAQHDEQQPSADRQEDKAKPEKQEEAKPGKQEEQARPGRQEEAKPGKQEEQAKPGKQEEQAKPGKREEQAKPVQNNQGERRMQGRGGKGGRIPDDKFRAQFGREHKFRMSRPTIVEGQPRFQYGGYWFVIVDPWPAVWLYTDECYIDYVDDQYYLFDVLHPGVGIVVTVVM
jgi:hypothetical protein